MQRRVFPLQILGLQPVDLSTARCRWIGHAEDGLSYYLKRCSDGERVPAAEYICTEMAAAVNLAVPPAHVALLDGGEQVFASREEGGLLNEHEWLTNIMLASHPPPSLAGHLSAWLAFDLFVHNTDRRIGNFCMRQTPASTSLLGIDFSEAWHVSAWPLPNNIGKCNTTETRDMLRPRFPLDRSRFDRVLDRIAALPDNWLPETLSHVPVRWLGDTFREYMTKWWRDDRRARIDRIRQDHANDR